jgi:COP9 signalosome complex subunit 6
MINVSDHHTRVKANAPPGAAAAPVLGCLLGSQAGRTVDISNSFEIDYIVQDGRVVINEAFLTRKQEQCAWGSEARAQSSPRARRVTSTAQHVRCSRARHRGRAIDAKCAGGIPRNLRP